MSKNPIKTIVNGTTIVKICVEDVNRLKDNICEILDRRTENIQNIIYEYPDEIKNVGVAKLQEGDTFNEEVGNEIAFRKVKLKANLKKLAFLRRIYSERAKELIELSAIYEKILKYVNKDIESLQKFNPDFEYEI